MHERLKDNEGAAVTLRLLTPARTGAVAVVELAGPAARLAALLAGRLDRPLPEAAERPFLRRWLDAAGQPLDEVLVLRRASADEAAVVEVHLHGGRGVLLGLVNSLHGSVTLLGDDATATDWPLAPTWSRDDVAASPSLRATYERALAVAPTAYLAKRLVAQLEAVPRWLDAYRAAYDAGDEATLVAVLAEARAGLELAAWVERARPPRVALAGAQNAGKSTLFNALTGTDRVLVSPHAGTTRDPVHATVAIRGIPVDLVDTAGLALELDNAAPQLQLRLSSERLEKRGQLRALRALREADLVLLLAEAAKPLPPLATLQQALPADAPPWIAVATKLDEAASLPDAGWLAVSAVAGTGLLDLFVAIASRLRIPPTDSIVPLLVLGSLRTWVAANPGNDDAKEAERRRAIASLSF